MKGKTFIDTNILIYAHDLDAGVKNEVSADLVLNLWENRMGIISTQVLQEFYVNVTRKILKPLSKSKARGIIESYLVWHVELNDIKTILFASEINIKNPQIDANYLISNRPEVRNQTSVAPGEAWGVGIDRLAKPT